MSGWWWYDNLDTQELVFDKLGLENVLDIQTEESCRQLNTSLDLGRS